MSTARWTIDEDGDVILEVVVGGARFGMVFCKDEPSGIFAIPPLLSVEKDIFEEKISDEILDGIKKVLLSRETES